MGNCLITKLKGIVNNDDLVKLDEIRFEVIPGATPIVVAGSNGTTVYAVKGTTFGDGTTQKTISPNAYMDIPANEQNGFILSVNKQEITSISRRNNDYTTSGIKLITEYGVSTSQISFSCIDLRGMSVSGNNIENLGYDAQRPMGNVDFSKLNAPNLLTVCLFTQDLLGAIVSLSSLTRFLKIEDIMIRPTVLVDESFDINNFASAQVGAGRTSGVCNVRTAYGYIVSKKVKYGTSMENPTPEDIANGYQLEDLPA